MDGRADTLEWVTRERDMLLELLELGHHDEVDGFLERALSLLIEAVGARRGCIELRGPADVREQPVFWLRRAMDEEALSADEFSRSVIAATFATGETVVTASAHTDPRFQDSGSVRANRIQAVLCAPMGREPVLGVIYLQDRTAPGPFSDHDRGKAELFARHIGLFAGQLLSRRRQRTEGDPTQPLRRKLKLAGIVGSSDTLAKVFEQVSHAAPVNVGVLLTGDTGTGKTQLARAIHDSSPRAAHPFVELNCALLSEELLENELFGAAPGGHSTAHKRSIGKIEAAERGTLFLDEVGDLPLRSQAKLLQVLQSGTYYALGDSVQRRANVRVIAATNADLKAAMKDKRFREDLYYRLSGLEIRVPSLAERRQDIAALAAHFCATTCEVNGLPALALSRDAVRSLEVAPWRGNIRELGSEVLRGVLRANADGSHHVERRHLFEAATSEDSSTERHGLTLAEATREFQKGLLLETLERLKWNVADVARAWRVSRQHVYDLMKAFGISRPEPSGGA